MVLKLITKFYQRYKKWQDKLFLQRQGCKNWDEYHHRYDAKVNWSATRIDDFYHGYRHRFIFDHKHKIYNWDLHWDGNSIVNYGQHGDVKAWCKTNCSGKYRMDFHRCCQINNEWIFDELGGDDYIWIAFDDERDLMLFILKWA